MLLDYINSKPIIFIFIEISGCSLHERSYDAEFEREIEINYLIRVGIAGPEGYYKKYGWKKSYFALLWEEKGMQKIGLFETQLEY